MQVKLPYSPRVTHKLNCSFQAFTWCKEVVTRLTFKILQIIIPFVDSTVKKHYVRAHSSSIPSILPQERTKLNKISPV